MDIWTKQKRSEVMSHIHSKNTKPEVLLRSNLHRKGYRFRIHPKNLPGKPDIVFPSKKVAIYVHGCFWHFHKDCPEGKIPKTNSVFWKDKLEKNIQRDLNHLKEMKKMGWSTIVVWECEIEKNIRNTIDRLIKVLK